MSARFRRHLFERTRAGAAHAEIDREERTTRYQVERYLRSLPVEELAAIEVVSIDPYEAYRLAVQRALPQARIVCDPFHLVRGANTALDTVRRERQRLTGNERSKGARRAGRSIWTRELYHSCPYCGAAFAEAPAAREQRKTLTASEL